MSIRTLTALLFVTAPLLGALAAPTASAAPSDNLLANPSFEQGLAGWSQTNPCPQTRATPLGILGAYMNDSGRHLPCSLDQDVPCVPGHDYQLSAFYRVVAGRMKMYLDFMDSAGTRIYALQRTIDAGERTVTLNATAPAGCAEVRVWYYIDAFQDGVGFSDDWRLHDLDSASPASAATQEVFDSGAPPGGQPLPPVGVPGVQTPDVPGTFPVGVTTPGFGPYEIPGPDVEAGVLSVHDSATGTHLCIDFVSSTPGVPDENLACIPRGSLGPADALVPRASYPIGTSQGPTTVGLDPQTIQVWPGSSPVPVPDVPACPAGCLATVPQTGVRLQAAYTYDVSRHQPVTLLGEPIAYPPFATTPDDAAWFATHGSDVPLTVAVTVYVDGQVVASRAVVLPWLGQIAATAGP